MTQRESFEKSSGIDKDPMAFKMVGDKYIYDGVQSRWETWQAAQAALIADILEKLEKELNRIETNIPFNNDRLQSLRYWQGEKAAINKAIEIVKKAGE